MKATVAFSGVLLLSVLTSCSGKCVKTAEVPCQRADEAESSSNAEELAKLLVKLELRTRAVIAGYYGKADEAHRKWLAENVLLPAAVADRIFHEVVPKATASGAWVKMVVDEPRNEHNKGDDTALALYHEIKERKLSAAQRTQEASYYGEPIKTTKACLACHGEPKGEPDPFFPQYKKNGWKEGEIVGAVIARVIAPK